VSWYQKGKNSLHLNKARDDGVRNRPKFGFGYGVLAKTTQKYGFGLVSVTAKTSGQIAVSAKLDNVESETSHNWIGSATSTIYRSHNNN